MRSRRYSSTSVVELQACLDDVFRGEMQKTSRVGAAWMLLSKNGKNIRWRKPTNQIHTPSEVFLFLVSALSALSYTVSHDIFINFLLNITLIYALLSPRRFV